MSHHNGHKRATPETLREQEYRLLVMIEAIRDRDERRRLALRAFELVQMAEAAAVLSDAERSSSMRPDPSCCRQLPPSARAD